MNYTIKLTVVVIADNHAQAVERIETAITLNKNVTLAYVASVDKVERMKEQ